VAYKKGENLPNLHRGTALGFYTPQCHLRVKPTTSNEILLKSVGNIAIRLVGLRHHEFQTGETKVFFTR